MSETSTMTNKQLKLRLETLADILGGKPNFSLSSSTENILDYLKVLAVYRRFDLEATRRELKNERGRKT